MDNTNLENLTNCINVRQVLLAIILSWALCALLTATDSISEKSAARTDGNLEIINRASWFTFPYPGQWGAPTVSIAGVIGMLAGVIASMIESIGDYYACARLASKY